MAVLSTEILQVPADAAAMTTDNESATTCDNRMTANPTSKSRTKPENDERNQQAETRTEKVDSNATKWKGGSQSVDASARDEDDSMLVGWLSGFLNFGNYVCCGKDEQNAKIEKDEKVQEEKPLPVVNHVENLQTADAGRISDNTAPSNSNNDESSNKADKRIHQSHRRRRSMNLSPVTPSMDLTKTEGERDLDTDYLPSMLRQGMANSNQGPAGERRTHEELSKLSLDDSSQGRRLDADVVDYLETSRQGRGPWQEESKEDRFRPATNRNDLLI
eukprot:scaffold5989_cov94-Cylindrotheca_fusiformis.AAC.1